MGPGEGGGQVIIPNRIIAGDNVKVMGRILDESIKLVITSPPYRDMKDYGGHAWDFDAVAGQLWRVIEAGGVVVWVVGDKVIRGSESGDSFRQALRFVDIGFRLHDTMIYQKSGGGNLERVRYYQGFEFMFVLSKGRPSTFNPICDRKNVHVVNRADESGERKKYGRRYNIWRYSNGGGRMGDCGDHPAPFPEQLAADHIATWSDESDIVLDPFCGSGTAAKMAKLAGRRYIGIDSNRDYCKAARKRVSRC